MSRKKTLTANQIDWLNRITETNKSASTIIGDLRGKARDYVQRYKTSLANAVKAHNDGSAVNSPLPADVRIEQTGNSYKTVVDPVIASARLAVEELAVIEAHEQVK